MKWIRVTPVSSVSAEAVDDLCRGIAVTSKDFSRLGRPPYAAVLAKDQVSFLKVTEAEEEVQEAGAEVQQCVSVCPLRTLPELTLIRLRWNCADSVDSLVRDGLHRIQSLLGEHGALPCGEGQRVTLKDEEDKTLVDVTVSATFPFSAGIWTKGTEVTLSFLPEDKPQDQAALLRYSLGAASASRSPLSARALAGELRVRAEHPLRVGELATALARDLVEEKGSESMTLFLNDVAVVGTKEDEKPPTFCWLRSVKNESVLLPCLCLKEAIPGAPSLLATPPLLQQLKDIFGNGSLEKISLSPAHKSEKAPSATEAAVAFISTSSYDDLVPSEVDSLLHSYFGTPRYLLEGQVAEVSLEDPDFGLPWEASSESGSVFFKVVSLDFPGKALADDKNVIGAVVDAKETRLYQKAKLKQRLPRRLKSKVNKGRRGRQACIAPPFLDRFSESICNQAASGHSSSFLLAGPTGCGLGQPLIQALQSRLGVSSVVTDCGSLVADASGTTEARLRQWSTKVAERRPCLAVLQGVAKLARNREGNIDYRCDDKDSVEKI